MIISLKVLGFDQSVTGTNPAKSPQSFFWFLKHGNQNQIRKLIIDEKEIDDNVELLKKKKIESFYETPFKSQSFKNVSEIENFLCGITTPSLNNDQINLCEKDSSKTDLYNAMKILRKIINLLEMMG